VSVLFDGAAGGSAFLPHLRFPDQLAFANADRARARLGPAAPPCSLFRRWAPRRPPIRNRFRTYDSQAAARFL